MLWAVASLKAHPGAKTTNINNKTMQNMEKTTIRSKLAVASTLAVLLGALTLFTTAGSNTPTLSDQLFAQRIAGSYLADQPSGSRLLVNLNLGGTAYREASFDFIGLSVPGLPWYFHGGGFGNWKRTGPRSAHLAELSMLYGPDGLVSYLEKVEIDLTFDEHLQSATATYTSGFYTPDQDPLTEEPAIPGPSGGGLVVRRIH